MNTLNGYSKSTLQDTQVLTAAGGHHPLGNTSGDIPLSNGIVNTNLNSDLLDSKHYDDIVNDVVRYNHTKGYTSSSGWYRIATLTAYGSYLLSISGTYTNVNSTAASFIINKSHTSVEISQIGRASTTKMISRVRIVKDATTSSTMYIEVYNASNQANSQEVSYRIIPLETRNAGFGLQIQNATLTTESLQVLTEILISTTHDVKQANSADESDTIDGYHIEVTSSPGSATDTIYFVL